ncbi:hypothetical protein [Bifidobacterium jacchi]|uniref:Uncharacterized protein n=1 Tax=Bifidobacterium jacchi TaxID=2490545 RepID=A0A5N5RC99_9BIFI|nr:hypothetical protein [Bifidobacterium jacchi]KAB5603608.1 hypothetical protein EHS19_10280 [Bifidobacterium jacchi]
MAWMKEQQYPNASVCISHRNRAGDIDCFLRILDYRENRKIKYVWAYQKPSYAGESRPADNPYTLYRPETMEAFQQSGDDYIFLRWKPNQDRPERPYIRDPYTQPYGFTPVLYEVIECPGNNSINDLIQKLHNGWPYCGKPTEQILIAYSENGYKVDTVLFNSSDFDYSKHRIRLKDTASSYATRYEITKTDIKKLPYNPSNGDNSRALYIRDYLPKPQERIPIRITAQFDTQFDSLLKQRQAELSKLEERIRDRAESYEKLQQLVEPLQTQVDELQRQLSAARADIKSVAKQKKVELANFEQQNNEELAKLDQQRQAVLDRFDDDVALKLGLRSVVRAALQQHADTSEDASRTAIGDNAAATPPRPQAVPYPSWPTEQRTDDFASVVADNLRFCGAISVTKTSSPPIELARACERLLSATKLLAVDSTFAPAIANSLSYAMYGRPARHVSIPTDWNDAYLTDRLLADETDTILVLDNVFDTVNEGFLFALTRISQHAPLILPIGAYGNLRLIAAEIWNQVFYLPTERHIMMPADRSPHMYRSADALRTFDSSETAVLRSIGALKKRISLPLSSLVLPASALTRFTVGAVGDSGEADGSGTVGDSGGSGDEGKRWVLPHLALQLYSMFGMEQARSMCIDGDGSIKAADELLTRIERGVERGQHAR